MIGNGKPRSQAKIAYFTLPARWRGRFSRWLTAARRKKWRFLKDFMGKLLQVWLDIQNVHRSAEHNADVCVISRSKPRAQKSAEEYREVGKKIYWQEDSLAEKLRDALKLRNWAK